MKLAKRIKDDIMEHKYFLVFLVAYLGTGFYFTYRLIQLMVQLVNGVIHVRGYYPN